MGITVGLLGVLYLVAPILFWVLMRCIGDKDHDDDEDKDDDEDDNSNNNDGHILDV